MQLYLKSNLKRYKTHVKYTHTHYTKYLKKVDMEKNGKKFRKCNKGSMSSFYQYNAQISCTVVTTGTNMTKLV